VHAARLLDGSGPGAESTDTAGQNRGDLEQALVGAQFGGIVERVAHGRGLRAWPTPTCASRSVGRLAGSSIAATDIVTAVYQIRTRKRFVLASGRENTPV